MAAYAASKGGVVSLTRSLALDLGPITGGELHHRRSGLDRRRSLARLNRRSGQTFARNQIELVDQVDERLHGHLFTRQSR